MKIRTKAVAVLLITLMISAFITGCTTDGSTDLFESFINSPEMDSFNSDTNMKISLDFDVNTSSFDQDTQTIINMYRGMLQNIELNLDQTFMKDGDEKYFTETYLSYNLGGLGFNVNMWQNYDLSEDNFKATQIIEIPQIFRPFIGELSPDMANVEYLVYDLSGYEELMEHQNVNLDFNQIAKLGEQLGLDLQEAFLTSLDEFEKSNEDGEKVISYMGKEIVDGKKFDIFEINFDDKSFKDFVTSTGNYILEREETKHLIEEYLNLMGELIYDMDTTNSMSKDEIEQNIQDMLEKLDMEKAKEKFNEFMNAFKDVPLIGENGIALTYRINEDGYLTEYAGTIDLVFDIQKINDLFAGLYAEEFTSYDYEPEKFTSYDYEKEISAIYLSIDFDSIISDINEVESIEFPEITEENSINFIQLMIEQYVYGYGYYNSPEIYGEQPVPDMPIKETP